VTSKEENSHAMMVSRAWLRSSRRYFRHWLFLAHRPHHLGGCDHLANVPHSVISHVHQRAANRGRQLLSPDCPRRIQVGGR
jgi:hypothetical protein